MSLAEQIEEMIEEAVEARVQSRLAEYQRLARIDWEVIELERDRTGWIELPDYDLMQWQKNEINEAIQLILSNQLSIAD